MILGTLRTGFVIALGAACFGCGGGGGSDSSPPPPPPQAPTFTSLATVSVPENYTDVVYRPVAVDAQSDPLTYSAIGGPDAAKFTVNPVTREVRFASPPDYEQPTDAGGNNIYDISFGVSDGTNTTTQNVTISVTNVRSGYNVRRIPWDSLTTILAGYPGGSGRIVMLRHTGTIALVDVATGQYTSMGELGSTPWFDSTVSGVITIYGLAFSPNFVSDRTFYIALYRKNQNIEVVKFRMLANGTDQVDVASADVIFRAPISGTQIDGVGFIEFDNLGRLYIGIGASAFESLGSPAQDPNSTYGKIMRIDPSSDAFPSDPDRDYAIPASNPFAAGGGLPEIYAMGVTRPRFAHFDPDTHSIMFSDQASYTPPASQSNTFQEVNRLDTSATQVQNFGWPLMAGSTPQIAGMTYPNLARPVALYDSLVGADIRGGITYRGPIEEFQGYYFFGDASNEKLWRLTRSQTAFGSTATSTTFDNLGGILPTTLGSFGPVGPYMIGTDTRGNLYLGTVVSGLSGLPMAGLYIVEPAP